MVARTVPLGRSGSGEEIAWMTLYLCSDQGSWITGQLYSVDGGAVTADSERAGGNGQARVT